MTKPVLWLVGEITDRMMERISADFEVIAENDLDDPEAVLRERGAEVVALVTDGHLGVRPGLMDALPNLKVISSYGVGYDNIDAAEAARRGILVAHTPDVLNDEVADTAIMLLLAVFRRLIPNDAWVRSGRWEREGAAPLTRSVEHRTFGILGLGRIGRRIAEKLAIFSPTILYHARSPRPDAPWEFVPDLVEMAKRSDALIVITPGGAGTRHLVNAEVIAALGPEGVLINVARGSVVDEAALVAALEEGRLGGAGLDVFENEPFVPEPLKHMDNVVLQPHVGSATVETRAAMGDLVCDNLAEWLRSGRVLTPVPECREINA